MAPTAPHFLLFDNDVCIDYSRDFYESETSDPGYETGYDTDRDQSPPNEKPATQFSYESASLPFGQHVELSAFDQPNYFTAQNLIEQVAFLLSDKIFSYSPETFDLDLSLKRWKQQDHSNVHGGKTGFTSLETRTGAGSLPLGYMFSKDFDLEKRHIPQSIVASSAALPQLRAALDQWSLLYSMASPLVAHVAAVDYAPNSSTGLVTDYITAMTHAEDLGLGLLSSTSTYEAQHMSLLATLFAHDVPVIHAYDGINVGRETINVVDVLGGDALGKAYHAISHTMLSASSNHLTHEGKLLKVLEAFNDKMGTDYKPFEYYGHAEPESVLVVFGSVEGSIGAQLAFALSNNGVKVGVINVRVYRPFVEEEFLNVLPSSIKHVAVLGQVKDDDMVADAGEHSLLYRDVLATFSLSTKFRTAPLVVDHKYSRDEVWTPTKMLYIFQHLKEPLIADDRAAMQAPDRPRFDLLGNAVIRYTFWDTDDSVNANMPAVISKVLSKGPMQNIQVRKSYDNLVQGGVSRTDVRSSEKSIEAPYSITSSNVTYVGEEKLLKSFDVVGSLQEGGIIVLRLPGAKAQDNDKIERRLPESFRSSMAKKDAQLFIFDPRASAKAVENTAAEPWLAQLAFLRFAWSEQNFSKINLLTSVNGEPAMLQALAAELESALWHLATPESWSSVEADSVALPVDISNNSFVPFNKMETEPRSYLQSWITTAKGLAFKEATGQQSSLRPDLGFKTHVVRVQERKRLTPASYDRNIFHIEFDLGDSGLTYQIGEALGIHPENNAAQVEDFIKWYGLNPEDIVEVPSREDTSILENRTIYQSLLSNLDIFGRPPKRFYEALSEFASDNAQATELLALGTGANQEAQQEFKRRGEVDTVTYADVLLEFSSAHPEFHDIVRLVAPLKRREYSVASSQKVTPTSISLLIVTVNWVDPQGRDRFGAATRYLNSLRIGSPVTVSVKPSVMKLPTKTTSPLIMAGLGTGLAPFRAFVQERAWQKQQGHEIGQVLLYMGSRHQREEYLYGEEWEAYQDAGVITLLGRAFSRDQPQKVYIQDRMRQTLKEIREAYLQKEGSFYLCGPTWPVPDVTEVLQEACEVEGRMGGRKVDGRKEIEKLKEEERYVLEVY